MTRDNLSYPWNATQHDLCHLLLRTAACQRTVRRGEERRGPVRSFVRRCYSMPPCGIAMATFAIILHVHTSHASRPSLFSFCFAASDWHMPT
jgi:hypothetical protein